MGRYWRGHPVHEFKFAVVVRDRVRNLNDDIFDRAIAAPYVDPVRHLVMPTVCAAASKLVEEVSPAVIYRATYFVRPPVSSLPKHQMITETLLQEGYAVLQEGADLHGRWYWLMQRLGVGR